MCLLALLPVSKREVAPRFEAEPEKAPPTLAASRLFTLQNAVGDICRHFRIDIYIYI